MFDSHHDIWTFGHYKTPSGEVSFAESTRACASNLFAHSSPDDNVANLINFTSGLPAPANRVEASPVLAAVPAEL
jgi:hypothetical protein